MARIEVVMPQMGESITEGTIIKWHKKVGEKVAKDETLLEISTDKVDSEIPSPAAGVLAEIVVEEQKTVSVRTVIAYLETDANVTVTAPPSAPVAAPRQAAVQASPAATTASPTATIASSAISAPAVASGTSPSAASSGAPMAGRFYSPLVLNIARTEGVGMGELERIPGTGEGGRVSKNDMMAYLAARKAGVVPSPAAAPANPAAGPAEVVRPVSAGVQMKSVEVPELRAKYPAPGHDILQMSNVQQKMAQHMVQSVQTSPHVSAVHEVDMTAIVKHRASQAAEFERKEGFKLTYTPYIVHAVVKAIKKFPLVNSSVEGDKIIRKNFINIGMAVASESGLLVPVIKHAEEKNFLGIAREVNDLAVRTRGKKLTPDDIQGGTFTISNFGVFGTMIGTPIINQPQVAILGTGAITKRVAVIDDAIAIRSMAYFTLSFDHRIVDGALGGMFMDAIVQGLQNFDVSIRF